MKLGAYRLNATTINLMDRDTGEDVASRVHEPGKEDETYEALMPFCNAVTACAGLDLPADVPPGILADFVKSMRLIGNQALSPDWTAEQAFDFMRAEAKDALKKINPIRRTASAISRQCAEEERDELATGLDEIRTLLSGHPEAAQGNSKVHFCMHRAAGLLAKLAPGGSPDNGKPVSPPEPEKPRLPEVIERAIRHAQSVDPSIDRVTFWEEQWWQFCDAGLDGPSFPPEMDMQPFEDATDYVYSNGGFPQSFQLVNTMA